MIDFELINNELKTSVLPETDKNELLNKLNNPTNADKAKTLKDWLNRSPRPGEFKFTETRLARIIALQLAWANLMDNPSEDSPLPVAALRNLYPKSLQLEIRGDVTVNEFLNQKYILLGEGNRITVQAMPQTNNNAIPMITNFYDIPTTFVALEEMNIPEPTDLASRVNRECIEKLLNLYKKSKLNTMEDIQKFLEKIPYRFSRAGYTGSPFTVFNTLCAQLAWLCVDKTKPDAQEQFWKNLYPEIRGVMDGLNDNDWPLYGEAILDDALANGQPGKLINYRSVYQHPSFIDSGNTDLNCMNGRVLTFCSEHQSYWSFNNNTIRENASQITTLGPVDISI
ncbi:MAG: hypothetical protein ACHQAX_04835 [Gammaproteobacteria bacterium]